MKNYLIKYKELTEKILDEIKKEELENALKVMDERELLLKEMSNINIDKNIDLEKELSLISLNKEIENEINRQKKYLKVEMETVKKSKMANLVYGKKFEDIYFLNKQI